MIATATLKAECVLRDACWQTPADLEAIADLHLELLNFGPVAGLGRRFVREIGYRVLLKDELMHVTLANVDGVTAGFVAFTPNSFAFHRRGLRKHLPRVAWYTLIALLEDPRRITKFWRVVRVMRTRRGEVERRGLGEVVAIAVRPQFLTAATVRRLGIRLSERLVDVAGAAIRRSGANTVRMLVDADNKAVLLLYHLMGAKFRAFDLGGEPNVEVEFDLSTPRFERSVPAAWQRGARGAAARDEWAEYWDGIDDRQRVFAAEAADHVRRVQELLAPADSDVMLDFGCGFGFVGRRLARVVRHVDLWDGSAGVRWRALRRTAHMDNVGYLDLDDPAADPVGKYDLITAHSVLQYMNEAQIVDWLRRWRRMLRPGGRVVVSDLIAAQQSPVGEVLRYLRFALANGFVLNALVGGVKESARYFGARRNRALTPLPQSTMARLAASAGFTLEPLAANLSYRRSRWTAVLRPAAEPR
jgi:2-polyprenyl-3-methyl-5-hydroxy-6-metoxy-1,4-benzoquinol methylase